MRLRRLILLGAAGASIAMAAVRARSRPREPIPTPEDLRIALSEAGIEAVVEEGTVTGGGVVGWIVTVTLATPVAAFFTAFGSEAGKDAYAAFHIWFRTQRSGSADSAAVIVHGTDDREVVLELGIADDAFEALCELDWSQVPTGTMVWDRSTRRWRGEGG